MEYQFESDDDMPILPPTDTEQSTGIPIPITLKSNKSKIEQRQYK